MPSLPPALLAHPRGALWLDAGAAPEAIPLAEAARRVQAVPPLLCHRPSLTARLGGTAVPGFDLLELYAFVRPARFLVPTPRGLAEALGLPPPGDHARAVAVLPRAAAALLDELGREALVLPAARRAELLGLAAMMDGAGWTWGPLVRAALGDGGTVPSRAGLRVWDRLPEWSEQGPEGPPGSLPVAPAEARARLAELLDEDAEPRPGQADFASAAALAFAPREAPDSPRIVLAEAGTGTGKTLGYIAPASLWAERNGAPVWISTYTRNLQRQLDVELSRLFPEPAEKARKVVIRKGRENYLCLLNFEEAVMRLGVGPEGIALGLLARWAGASRDGDMIGGDLPGWLVDLLGRGRTLGLADRRGECIHSACPHYRRCVIERGIRKSRRAEIVVANHALVMVQAALGGLDDGLLPTRIVFDEGHHVFEAADNAFAAALSGQEAAELRRWLLGAEAEGGRTSRSRGLRRRSEDLVAGDEEGQESLNDILAAARALPGPAWHQRVVAATGLGACEAFLTLVRRQVLARSQGEEGPYSLECATTPLLDGLGEAADRLDAALLRLRQPLEALARRLAARLDDEAAELDSASRQRIEALLRGIRRRALLPLAAWRGMLAALEHPTPAEFVDWFAIDRIEGRETDVGFHRHWVDPAQPFAEAMAGPTHGMLITSASLRDQSGDVEADWQAAERRTGARHLPGPVVRAALASPFDYGARTRLLVVRDVRRDDPDQVAAAYRELFLAAGGGALGLFTAIGRLRAVQSRIAAPLDAAGLLLLSQHDGSMDTSTVVDIFRAEEDSCLLGTDAVRDGVDVPGRSLRLIVFDRVPWPRPDILHKARREAFGGQAYDDLLVRARLRQAFGRLIRRADDAGVFVLLDSGLPTRLVSAFPEGVTPLRTGLAEAVRTVREFLASTTSA